MRRLLGGVVLIALLVAATVVVLNLRDEDGVSATSGAPSTPEQIARGEALARAGNCMGCHTARGGQPFAGGRGIVTPFGTVFSSNLTPDATTGLGAWTSAHFWRALHNGRSRDGRLLYAAFPYPNYTLVTREDSDALFAFLRSLPPTVRANQPHALRFPYDTQAALAVWRALYFRAAKFEPDAARSAEWNRGAYLVQGLGHCNACHASRNALGAPSSALDLGGGLIPMQNWYAPSLASAQEAGVATWTSEQIVALLKTGVTAYASTLGPMAEVVAGSTQYLSDGDLAAMAVYLKAVPQAAATPQARASQTAGASGPGAKLYERHCAQCHGDAGEGAPGAYPALAGNRAVTIDPPANLVRVVLGGGFPPATAGNQHPFGMPPFATVLGNDEVAAVVSYIRAAWGNGAAPASPLDVNRYRSSSQ